MENATLQGCNLEVKTEIYEVVGKGEVDSEFALSFGPVDICKIETGGGGEDVESDHDKDMEHFFKDPLRLQLDEISTHIKREVGATDSVINESSVNETIVEIVPEDGCESEKPLLDDQSIIRPAPRLKKPSTVICVKCNTGFSNPDLYEHHVQTAHQKERPFPCRHCSKRFAEAHGRKRHERIHDPNRFQGPPQFPCDMCDKRYHLKSSLDTHRKLTHLGYKKVNKNYAKLPVFQHHSKKGTKNPNYKPVQIHPCPYCDLKFYYKSTLENHMRGHTKEKPVQCSICEQRFSMKKVLNQHIKKVHEKETSSAMANPRPRWQAGQPCPCKICGKVFKVPFRLRDHMYLHTGEKPFPCTVCKATFRTAALLKSHRFRHEPPDTSGMHTVKCRICGTEKYQKFQEYHSHRLRTHKHIPSWGEGEKAFACGLCGKPHYKRIGAVICAVLGHDPKPLLEKMFKFKCPECSPERLGYHNMMSVRRHWKEEHGHLFLPLELRRGWQMEGEMKNELPKCKIDKMKADELRRHNGVLGEDYVKLEQPLFVELDLLPIPEEKRFLKRKSGGGRPRQNKVGMVHKCEICELNFVRAWNLKEHLKLHDSGGPVRKRGRPPKPGKVENAGVKKEEGWEDQGNPAVPKRGRGRPRKKDGIPVNGWDSVTIKMEPAELSSADKPDILPEIDSSFKKIPASSLFKCRFCPRKFANLRAIRLHELRAHVKPWSTSRKEKGKVTSVYFEDDRGAMEQEGYSKVSVNIHDKTAVKALLDYKVVKVKLIALDENGPKEKDLSRQVFPEQKIKKNYDMIFQL